MYGEGISKNGELLDLGVTAGVVEKSGSWFSYAGERIGQGRENAKTFLKQHPDVAEAIERKIRENAGLIAAKITNPSGEEDDRNADAAE
jgi:recombination protein RecA